MLSSPPYLSTEPESQADILDSPLPPPLHFLESPQLSQTSLSCNYLLFDHPTLSPELELHPPYLLDREIHVPSHDYYTSLIPLDRSATPEIDSWISSFSEASPDVLTTSAQCICGCGGDPCIPQQRHRRPKDDPLEEDRVGELITFKVHGKCGMPLRDALYGRYGGLSDRDDPMFVGSRTSISIRLLFPDCPPWAQQMRTKDWRRKPSPIAKAKLATEIAKKVDRFLKDMQRYPRGSQSTSLSPGILTAIDHLSLVALEHVSMASWQPHLRRI